MSLVQRIHFYRTYSKWPPLRWWHTWICPAKLSISLMHFFFQCGTNLLIDIHFEFSNELWIVLIHVFLQKPPEMKIWGRSSDRLNAKTSQVCGACWSVDGRATPSWWCLYVDWFALVSLFNGISTFVGYLMPKPFFKRRTVVVLFN